MIDYGWENTLDQASRRSGLPVGEVEQRVLKSGLCLDFELGRISGTEFHAGICSSLGMEISFAEFFTWWNSIFRRQITPIVEVATELLEHPSIKVALLSNTNALHIEHVRDVLPLLKKIKYLFFSHEIASRKPDLLAFQKVLSALNVKPERSVFVDDLDENVTAARGLGISTVHVQDAALAAARIRQLLSLQEPLE